MFCVRCGGSLSCHPARGAGHQGDGGVLGEAAAAAEGHQPRVEQPHRLHVAGQARCKTFVRTHRGAQTLHPFIYLFFKCDYTLITEH